jgi:hypothetical protein
MSALPLKTAISDIYPNPSNAIARAGFAALWDAINESLEKSELDIASAATCDIGGQLSTKIRITGTTTITSFGTNYRGPIQIRMSGIVTLTHNATTLRCPGATNITTAAGDVLLAWPTATVSGTLDGWQVAILARGTGGETFPGAVVVSGASFTPSQTHGIVGTTTNNSANAGSVGEVISSSVLVGSAVALTSTANANVTSISLTAGHWDVVGRVAFTPGATTSVTALFGSISQTSATHGNGFSHYSAAFVPNAAMAHTATPQTIKLSSTTTIYLVATANFTVSTMTAHGEIVATRRR